MPNLVQHFIPSYCGQLTASCYDGGCLDFQCLGETVGLSTHSWAVEGDWWQRSSFNRSVDGILGDHLSSTERDFQVSRQGRRPLCSYPPGSMLVHAGGRMSALCAWICSPWSRGGGASVTLRTWSLTTHCSSTCTSLDRRWVLGDETPRAPHPPE